MRKPAVLLMTFLLLCASSGVALFFLFSSWDVQGPAAPRMKPAPRTRSAPSVGKNAREAFVLRGTRLTLPLRTANYRSV
jgi:hypothetical protein